MKLTVKRLLCQFLVIAMAVLPFQQAQAGMVGTGEVINSAASQVDRNTVLNFLDRAESATQLQAMGVDAKTAKERVASLTDEEVSTLAGKISSLPAGGDGAGVLILLIIIGLVWYFWVRR